MRPGFLPPFGHRHSLLGSSCSRPGTGPSLRSAYRAYARTRTGFPRSAPARYDRDGCPLYPGDGGARPGQMPCPAVARRFPAASPCTPQPHPTSGAPHYGASTGVHAIHPSGLPLACGPPDGTGGPWAFPCAPHPAVTSGARQGGAGREHAPRTTRPTSSALQSASSLAKCDLVSQRQLRTFSSSAVMYRYTAG